MADASIKRYLGDALPLEVNIKHKPLNPLSTELLKNQENDNFSKNFRITATHRILMVGTALESLEAALLINLVLENI